jgi:LysR family transcriptional regulator, glycine cleavage system transcriptional activator
MPLRLPPLAALRLFEAAARHQSFKFAAEELNLTASAVSHGVSSLESALGVKLFKRSANRGVSLTPAGRHYLPYVSEALSMIAVGTQRLPGRRTDRRVAVSVAPTFALRWLLPRLPAFARLHPGIRLTLDTSHRQILFPLDGFDLAIRMGSGEWPGVESQLLFTERLQPVAEPGYLAARMKNGALDWSRVTFLHVASIENDWNAWLQGAGGEVPLHEGIQCDTIQLALAAAAQGLGVAMGHFPLADEDVVAGRLVPALPTVVPVTTGYWLVGTSGEETRTEVRSFRRWVLEEAAKAAAPPDAPPALLKIA